MNHSECLKCNKSAENLHYEVVCFLCNDTTLTHGVQESNNPSSAMSITKIETSVDQTFEVVEDLSEQLLSELRKVHEETGKVSDEVLTALSSVFQAPLLPALDLVDNRSVTLVTCPAGRTLYQVVGSSGTPYTCFSTSSYCSCPAYRFSVLKKEDHTMCKHVLAIKLSAAMGLCKQLEVSNDEMATMISEIE